MNWPIVVKQEKSRKSSMSVPSKNEQNVKCVRNPSDDFFVKKGVELNKYLKFFRSNLIWRIVVTIFSTVI